jgi:deoxyribodipyrimidine photo-lyase
LAPRPPALQRPVPALAELGFEATNLQSLALGSGENGAAALLQDFRPRLDRYHSLRDLPAAQGPSYLGVHLRFGTVSIRQLAALAQAEAGASAGAATWLKELAWRDFYFQVLANFPQVGQGRSFKPEYDRIAWDQGPLAEQRFAAWCQGRTGYPLVDAAMTQLKRTGYMHNRLRMVTASFLCKDLGIDWRWGERHFAEHLNDYDLAANNGGWQWASSSGCDAQPWFRIFNPVSQSQRFDAQGSFILRYLPQLAGLPPAALHAPWLARPVDLAAAGIRLGMDYPLPIVDHAEARAQTLRRYAVVKAG